jgi:hypothetical protein
MKSNLIVGGIAVLSLLGALAFFGLTPFGKTIVQQMVGASPAGTTSQTAKFAGVVANLLTIGANGTSSSILNGDANDRYITSIDAGCEGLGQSNTTAGGALANLLMKAATTSTANPPAITNTNLIGVGQTTIGTTTGNFVSASSTAAGTSGSSGSTLVNNIWAAGSYLTFTVNATNTAACTFGVKYFSS